MEFLDKLVLPQSAEHIELLHYIQILIFFLFIPFMSAVFGGALISVYYKNKGVKEANGIYLRFSRDVIETVTVNKSLGVILGIVPLLVSVIIYAQLLHTQNSDIIGYLALGALLCSIGIVIIYTYRYSSSYDMLFNSYKDISPADEKTAQEFKAIREGSSIVSRKAAIYGILFLAAGLWFFTAGVILSAHPKYWQGNFIYNIFNWRVFSGYGQFLAISFAIAGAELLFAYFFWEGGKKNIEPEYSAFIRKKAISFAFWGVLLQPVFLAINTFALPAASLSGGMFSAAVIALIMLFLAYHYLYAMVKYSSSKYSGYLFYVVLIALLAIIVKDQLAMGNATKMNSQILAGEYTKYLAELEGVNTKAKPVSGEEVFKNICSACHAFDHKVVGPAYKDVLPKYEGKTGQLIAFIRNPVKMNPAFPPMPNPGLKPAQAEAVAKYILETYKKK